MSLRSAIISDDPIIKHYALYNDWIVIIYQILLIETKLRGNLQKDNTSTWWCHGGCRYSKGPTLTSFQLRSIFS